MNTFENIFKELSEETPVAKKYAGMGGTDPLSISQPIDTGAVALLQPFSNSYVSYPPLEVEYLVQTLNEHISNCLDLRMKAQDLEVRTFSEVSEQLLQRRLLEALKNQMQLIADNEPKLLGNKVDIEFSNKDEIAKVTGKPIDYWKDLLKEQEAQRQLKLGDADERLKRLQEAGSGNNYVARFEFLKQLFNIDLKEAYCRALSAHVGLKAIYGIDIAFPPLTETGYLDKLTIWARTVTYELEKKFFNLRDTTVLFALSDGTAAGAQPADLPTIMNQAAFENGRTAGSWTFNFTEAILLRPNAKFKNARLRGLDAHVWVKDDKDTMQFWRVLLKGPNQKIPLASGLPAYSYDPMVYVPMSTYPRHIIEVQELPNQREVHNVSPVGEWTLRIEPKSIIGNTTNDANNVTNIILRMRIVYEKD